MYIRFISSVKYQGSAPSIALEAFCFALTIYCSVWTVRWILWTIAAYILLPKASAPDRFIITNGLGYWHATDVLEYFSKGIVPEVRMKLDDELITAYVYPCLLFAPLLLSAFKQYRKPCYNKKLK